jgi:hypothetical protein
VPLPIPGLWWFPFIVLFGVVTLASLDNVLTPGQEIRFDTQQSVSDRSVIVLRGREEVDYDPVQQPEKKPDERHPAKDDRIEPERILSTNCRK